MSNTGRFYIKKGDRLFCVEPIDNSKGMGKRKWGNLNPATGNIEGNYGNKGSITEEESIITKENGFKNIIMLEEGVSPIGYSPSNVVTGLQTLEVKVSSVHILLLSE